MNKSLVIVILLSLSLLSYDSSAQLKFLSFLNEKIDTNYISDKTKMLTVRALASSKYQNYRLIDGGKTLSYKANNSYNIGLGGVYGPLGINLTVKMPLINNDNEEYGKTKKLDIQAYAFPRKVALDLYLQYYKGFYIGERDATRDYLPENRQVQRGDITTYHVGANASYVFNAKKFSFRAAFIQNEYQKKSAGTPLLGGGFHYNRISGDSAIIPMDITYSNFFDNNRFNTMGAFSLGVHGGYAYTLVLAKHFFITGAALVGVGGNYSFTKDDVANVSETRIGVQTNLAYKAAIGYNSERFYAGLLYIGYAQRNSSPVSAAWQQFEPSVVRLVLAKRFTITPPWEKKKKPKAVLDIQ